MSKRRLLILHTVHSYPNIAQLTLAHLLPTQNRTLILEDPALMAGNHTTRAISYAPPYSSTNDFVRVQRAAAYATATFTIEVFVCNRPETSFPLIVAVDEEFEQFHDDIRRRLGLDTQPLVEIGWKDSLGGIIGSSVLSPDTMRPWLRAAQQIVGLHTLMVRKRERGIEDR